MEKKEILYKALENENAQMRENIIKYKAAIEQLHKEKEQIVESKIVVINEKNTEINNLKKYYTEMINQIYNEKEQLQTQLDSITNSRSYKITQKLKRIIKR